MRNSQKYGGKNQIGKIKASEKNLPRLKGKDKEIKIKKEKLNDNADRHKTDIMHYKNIRD